MNKEQLLAWAVTNVTVWPHSLAAALVRAPDGVTWCDDVSAEPYLWTLDGKHLVFKGEWEAARVACGMPQSAPVQQNKLTADEALTWVARNVHMWEDAQQIVGNQREFFYNSASFWDDRIDFTGCAVRTITRDQWLARRAELQNKPIFADHPDAKCFVQDDAGHWYKNVITDEVYPRSHFWWMDFDGYQHNGFTLICKGELLGDWSDTLERRPADLSEEAVTERLTEAAQVVLAAVPELMGEKYKFDRGVTAHSILEAAGGHMRDRAATYDKPEGERSMGATVGAFCAITGHNMTEEQGWLFMQLLKAVRSQQGAYRADSYEDGAAYVALAGEAAARERGGAQ